MSSRYYKNHENIIDSISDRIENFSVEMKSTDRVSLRCMLDGHVETKLLFNFVNSVADHDNPCGCASCGNKLGGIRSRESNNWEEIVAHTDYALRESKLDRTESNRLAAKTQIKNGTGMFSEEAQKKASESNNRNRELRGNVWANESSWEQEIAKEFGGICGVRVYCKTDRTTRWPDIVFPDGHVIQIDDVSHRNKRESYEKDYDDAMESIYGHRPLHLMLPHKGCCRRPGYEDYRQIIRDYLNDTLESSLFIMIQDSWYPNNIIYK